jgi:hypothetical protein
MRDSLRKHGSDLLLRFGKMEEAPEHYLTLTSGDRAGRLTSDWRKTSKTSSPLSRKLTSLSLCARCQFYTEELAIERKLRESLKELGVTCLPGKRASRRRGLRKVQVVSFFAAEVPERAEAS